MTKNAVAGTVEAMKELNDYLRKLTETIQVTIMPGATDPASAMLPQQPLHPCMFTDKSGVLETATNPYMCDISGVRYAQTFAVRAESSCTTFACRYSVGRQPSALVNIVER